MMVTVQTDSGKVDLEARTLAILKQVFGSIDSLKLPIDLNRVADACGLTIKQGDFNDPEIEGAFDRGSMTVFLSKTDPFDKQNFTLAHEIGHLELHKDLATNIFTMHQLSKILLDGNNDPQEEQANQFAASLLIPKQLLQPLWKASKDIEQLALIFGVPQIVMQYRLKQLKLQGA